jgi:hypothetical protein
METKYPQNPYSEALHKTLKVSDSNSYGYFEKVSRVANRIGASQPLQQKSYDVMTYMVF